jgi:twitching motility protein PilU
MTVQPGSETEKLLDRFVQADASDLYLTVGAPPSMRTDQGMKRLSGMPMEAHEVRAIIEALLSAAAQNEFSRMLEYNTAIEWKATRLRINCFVQRQHPGMVIRRIRTRIPTFQELGLPAPYGDLSMEPRGLVVVVGPTGSGKSSSLAAMIGHRNQHGQGHIVTIEDPVEFVHEHQNCIITQRDVGIDTLSFHDALKNALRQRPDVIVIGEIRDSDTMEHALNYAETGHLCLATLHAPNTSIALDRIVNLFPKELHGQVLMSLSLNLRGVLAQRLVHTTQGNRTAATEILLNEGHIRTLIQEGKFKDTKDMLEKGNDFGMHSFDQCVFQYYMDGKIEDKVAINEGDNPGAVRLMITQAGMAKQQAAAVRKHGETGF